ncbi:MAG: hypothetical protein JNG88_08425 [Phycisphaerales bacterium]|nr:hypothetical protein [Phycisphaerales bacterium]
MSQAGRCGNFDPFASPTAMALVMLVALAAGCAGCGMRVTAPSCVGQPVRVILIDYGYHSSIVLSDESGKGREFAFGEYAWFAENHDGPLDVCRIALLPGSGTLGIRDYPAPLSIADVSARTMFEAAYELNVERERALLLRQQLDERYRAAMCGGRAAIYNPVVDLHFVRVERVYWWAHNCNHQLAEWLEALGCEVDGCRVLAEFRILSSRPSSSAPP